MLKKWTLKCCKNSYFTKYKNLVFLYFRKIVPLFNIHKKLIKSINNYILLPFGAVVVDIVVDVEVVEVISKIRIKILNDIFSFHAADPNERIL